MRPDIHAQEVFLGLILDDATVRAEFEAMMAAAFPPSPPDGRPPSRSRHPAFPALSADPDDAPGPAGRHTPVRRPGAAQERSPPAMITTPCP